MDTDHSENRENREFKAGGHWYIWWALATLVPFSIVFFLSWLWGAPGGYQMLSQSKLFLLFLQVGFVTAYFIRHHLPRAAVHLWVTLLLLFLLSLIVPYLSTQTDVVLDMGDITSEFSTPMYLFVSCLTAAWLLPEKWRLAARILCVALILLYILIQFTYIGYYFITHSLISINMILAMAQTNLKEAADYINLNLPYAWLMGSVAGMLCFLWLLFYGSDVIFDRPLQVSRPIWAAMLFFFLANCGLTALSLGGTHIARVYAETYDTLQSFAEFQKILETRRNMHIDDPELVERLKAAPDGVYVLVIGESLTRDHMNVYRYPRRNTPFQSDVVSDPHYTFFNHVYSCYTQTVQVLTYALTEKNQYNDMDLVNAYSLIDMAREAGFHTTWISNQSRFGIWDTPIGAIGSECDDQYWINQYIGTNVVTKDYDTALVSYLRKIDPSNRRQLIVLHLMGSHVNYWDRYPQEFYHWPIDQSRPRTTEEIMNDEYDNSVIFNDYVMASIMNEAVNYLHADGVVYFSDHGEEVSARPGHNADQFNFEMARIPFWIYSSDTFMVENPRFMTRMRSRRNMPFTNDMLYDTMMGMMGLTAAHYDARSDFFSDDFDKDVTTLMTMHGNVMVRTDVEQLGPGKKAMDDAFNEKVSGMLYDWTRYTPVKLAEPSRPEVKNDGLSQEKASS